MLTLAKKEPTIVAGLEPPLPPLFLDGWLEFNRIKWHVEPKRLEFGGNELKSARLSAVLFLNKKGKISRPPCTPYLSLVFRPSPTNSPRRISHQWLQLAGELAEYMRLQGLADDLVMPPEIIDVRPWQWVGFQAEVRYTYYLDFPVDLDRTNRSIRQEIRKAKSEGYSCGRTNNFADVSFCLEKTAARQNFSLNISQKDLEMARDIMGDEHFRTYVCYAPDGAPVSARTLVFSPGARAFGWIAGTYIRPGTAGTEILLAHIVQDLQESGATGFDLVGANIPGVAAAKSKWGCSLIPFYTIQAHGLRRTLSNWRGRVRSGIVHLSDL